MKAPAVFDWCVPAYQQNRVDERRDLERQSAFTVEQREAHGLTSKQVKNLKISLVCSDCVLIGLQPILVYMSKNSDGKFSYNPVSVNFLTEVCKVIFAIGVLLVTGTGRPGTPMYRSIHSFIRDERHNRLLMIPAALYAINNYLKFVMQLYFRPTTAKMLGNLKIFTIAILLKVIMNRRFSIIQWEALFLLVFGITINQLANCSTSGATDPISTTALIYTLGSITIPAAASVYNEQALKKHMTTSVHLQNFFLYFYGMVFNLIGLWIYTWTKNDPSISLFGGFTRVTTLLLINNAAQGILSSFFFKFADTILKKYSSTLATIFTGIMSAIFFGHDLTINFVIGISIVFISMHQFFTFGDKRPRARTAGQTPLASESDGEQQQFILSPSSDHLKVLGNSRSSSPEKSILPN